MAAVKRAVSSSPGSLMTTLSGPSPSSVARYSAPIIPTPVPMSSMLTALTGAPMACDSQSSSISPMPSGIAGSMCIPSPGSRRYITAAGWRPCGAQAASGGIRP